MAESPTHHTEPWVKEHLAFFEGAIADATAQMRKHDDWISATLLALNGGAIIALLGPVSSYPSLGAAVLAFGLSLILTLVAGMIAWTENIQRLRLLTKKRDLLEGVRLGFIAQTDLTVRWPKRSPPLKGLLHPAAMQSFAVGIFTAGACVAGLQIIRIGSAAAPLCAQVEADLLRRVPIRSDSPAVYQALGCRPRSGGVYAPASKKGT